MKKKPDMLFKQVIYKYAIIVWMIIMSIPYINAQLPPVPVIQSPNASSLGTFGNIPVSYFTGTPDISVPIYTLSCGDIKIPIELKYHPATVKPNEHPGWVGLGWNLQSYGCITRVAHGMNDEDNSVPTSIMPYYPKDNTSLLTSGCYKLNTPGWNLKSYLKTVLYSLPQRYDVCADEFYFNFLGYSGKFMYTYDGWKVISDQNIKIELGDADGNEFISGYDQISQIIRILLQYGGSTNTPDGQPRMFYGFTLTTEDGTKYYFGGEGAIEYSTNYYNLEGIFSLNTWYLKKIKDVNGNVVTFSYEAKNPVTQLAYYSSAEGSGCSRGTEWLFGLNETFMGGTGGNVSTLNHSGRLIWPLYLHEISTSKEEKITFNSTNSVEKRYPRLFFTQQNENGTGLDMDHYYRIYENPDNIQWKKLDDITISQNNAKILGYNFYYNPSDAQRLTLDSIREIDKNNSLGKVYKFEYDDIAGLPDYGGNWTDHWGYYNGTDINNTSWDIFYNNKNTNNSLVTKGLINKISYPTGGYTSFVWEANSCSYTVGSDHQSLSPFYENYGNVGGCRIKKIENYTATNATPITRTYYYVTNYSNSTYNASSPSSGILNGIPKYHFSATNRPCDIGNDGCTISFSFYSTNGFSSYTGPHIGYNEVIEKTGDGSYTKYLFSNYGLDSNGKTHYDTISTYIGWKAGEDTYIPFSSRELERGKMLGVYKFKNNDIPVEKTFFRYRDDHARFDNYIRRMDYRNSIGCSDANSIIFACTLQDFNYNYYLVQKETDQYDINGIVTLKDITGYSYNMFNQIATERKTNSNNSELTTSYKYPMDYSDFESLPEIAQLKQKYIINPLIEKVARKDNKIVDGEYTEYNTFFTNLIKPQKVYQFNSPTPIVDNDFYFKKYTIEEDDENLWVEEGCDNTQSATFNVDIKAQADISLRLFFPSSVCGYYTLGISGSQYKVYTGLSDNYTLETKESMSLSPGSYTITLSYITYPGYELSAMLGSADITFRNFTGNIQFNSSLMRPIETLDYNNSGQINEIQKTDDNEISYIWAYNNTYPVVKAENVSNSALSAAVTSIQSNMDDFLTNTIGEMTTPAQKTAWKSFSSSLRSALPTNTMISTYTYKPLVGMTSSTGPDGVTTYYEYDSFGRLQYIKDDDGRILKSYEYHYKQ